MRSKSPARVVGPYQERGKWRIVVIENGTRQSFFFTTYEEALKQKADFGKEVTPPLSRKLADVLDEWEATRMRKGTCKPSTIKMQAVRARLFLAAAIEKDIAAVTARGAAKLYLDHSQRASSRTGKPLSAASRKLDLWSVRDLFAWATGRGYVAINPFLGVKNTGRINAGKPQLRIEEARRFTEAALQDYEVNHKPLAIGALLALSMGLRTGEILKRTVRDLDDDGHCLWIDEGKTANARRHLEVPELVRPYLMLLTSGKGPDDLLFGGARGSNRPHRKEVMYLTVRRLCKRAGVPRVCTHSLRGLWATLAVRSGAASHAVAESLGHHSFAITQRHYAQASAITNAGTARMADELAGNRSPKRLGAADLIHQLDEDTLAELTELLAARKRKDDPAQ